jgi:lipopolysaccharide transport system ATP-binding protein
MVNAVTVTSLGKRFQRFRTDRPRSIKEMLFRGLSGMQAPASFWALRHIDLEVERGSILAIIGHNGAGKSTLLRLIGNIGRPDEGRVEVSGCVTGLLELGTGFHPDLSGRENVYVSGIVAGLTRAEVRERFEAIVDFAELKDDIDSPLRAFSQGMKQRLGFAVATHTDPEILLIDEMLAVGDRRFNRKCIDRISQFREAGCAIILVTHSMAAVRKLCDEAIQLRQGEIVARGAAEEVVCGYEAE